MDLKSNGRGVESIVNILRYDYRCSEYAVVIQNSNFRLYDYDVAVVENISGLLKTMSKYGQILFLQ